MNQEQRQKEQRQKLAEYAVDLRKQKPRQDEQRKKLAADISGLDKQEKRQKKVKRDRLKQKQEQKSVNPKIIGTKQDGTVQKRDEQDNGELQRQGQEELADLEWPSPLELEYGETNVDQSAPETRAQNQSMDAVQEGGTQVNVSAPEGEKKVWHKSADGNRMEHKRRAKRRG